MEASLQGFRWREATPSPTQRLIMRSSAHKALPLMQQQLPWSISEATCLSYPTVQHSQCELFWRSVAHVDQFPLLTTDVSGKATHLWKETSVLTVFYLNKGWSRHNTSSASLLGQTAAHQVRFSCLQNRINCRLHRRH